MLSLEQAWSQSDALTTRGWLLLTRIDRAFNARQEKQFVGEIIDSRLLVCGHPGYVTHSKAHRLGVKSKLSTLVQYFTVLHGAAAHSSLVLCTWFTMLNACLVNDCTDSHGMPHRGVRLLMNEEREEEGGPQALDYKASSLTGGELCGAYQPESFPRTMGSERPMASSRIPCCTQ